MEEEAEGVALWEWGGECVGGVVVAEDSEAGGLGEEGG